MESRTDYGRRRLSTRALTTRVAALAGAATLVLGAGLSWQMAQGADPALGPQATAQSGQQPRRVVKTLVIRRVQTPSVGSGASSSGSTSATTTPPVSAAPAPVTTSTS